MELTEELKRIYTSNPSGIRTYTGIELSHPLFSKDYYFVSDSESHMWYNDNEDLVEFTPLGFKAIFPTSGENQQDLKILLDNTNLQLVKELNNASADIKTPIILKCSVYIDGELAPQNETYILELKNVVADFSNISATASASNMIDIDFPKEKFDSRWTGLFI